MDALEAGAVIDSARVMVDDTTVQYRWSDEFMLKALNEAQIEACFRGKLLNDDTTEEIAIIQLQDGIAEYALDQRVFDVDRVSLVGDMVDLRPILLDELNRMNPYWRRRTSRVPCRYMLDWLTTRQLRLTVYPRPAPEQDEYDSLRILACRYPLDPVDDLGAELEIDPHHQEMLAHWVAYRCYMDRDPDRYDPIKAGEHKALFEESYGIRESAYVQTRRIGSERHTTRPRRF